MSRPLIGMLGGSFDPIHNGHLYIAKTLLNRLPIKTIHVMPCYKPPYNKILQARPQQRLQMVKLALLHQKNLIANDWEIKRQGISYTVDTLTHLQRTHPQCSLALILGMDVFINFTSWHQWQQIIKRAHLIIINRLGYKLTGNDTINQLLKERRITDSKDLQTTSQGRIFYFPLKSVDIAASTIRYHLANGKITALSNLPPKVGDFIIKTKLYQLSY